MIDWNLAWTIFAGITLYEIVKGIGKILIALF